MVHYKWLYTSNVSSLKTSKPILNTWYLIIYSLKEIEKKNLQSWLSLSFMNSTIIFKYLWINLHISVHVLKTLVYNTDLPSSAPYITGVTSLVLHLFHIISCLFFVHVPTFCDYFLQCLVYIPCHVACITRMENKTVNSTKKIQLALYM